MNMILNKNKGEFIQFTTLIIFTYCTSWTSYSKAFLVATGNQPQKNHKVKTSKKLSNFPDYARSNSSDDKVISYVVYTEENKQDIK